MSISETIKNWFIAREKYAREANCLTKAIKAVEASELSARAHKKEERARKLEQLQRMVSSYRKARREGEPALLLLKVACDLSRELEK